MRPLITILLAVYCPNPIWFEKLLDSLNEQTYENLTLIILDDCSGRDSLEVSRRIIKKRITRFPVEFISHTKNRGSNRAFEFLTQYAEGAYFAYCDQDDIWEKNKIDKLYQALTEQNAVLAYCDLSVIDSQDRLQYHSLQQDRKRLQYFSGENLTEKYIFVNCTAGCAILVKSMAAKKAIPFPKDSYWDHWMCIIASSLGRIAFVDEQLVRYRLHGENQSGILADIITKQDYYRIRVNALRERAKELKKRGILFENQDNVFRCIEARDKKDLLKMWKYRTLCQKDILFEMGIKYMPQWFVRKIISKIKKN